LAEFGSLVVAKLLQRNSVDVIDLLLEDPDVVDLLGHLKMRMDPNTLCQSLCEALRRENKDMSLLRTLLPECRPDVSVCLRARLEAIEHHWPVSEAFHLASVTEEPHTALASIFEHGTPELLAAMLATPGLTHRHCASQGCRTKLLLQKAIAARDVRRTETLLESSIVFANCAGFDAEALQFVSSNQLIPRYTGRLAEAGWDVLEHAGRLGQTDLVKCVVQNEILSSSRGVVLKWALNRDDIPVMRMMCELQISRSNLLLDYPFRTSVLLDNELFDLLKVAARTNVSFLSAASERGLPDQLLDEILTLHAQRVYAVGLAHCVRANRWSTLNVLQKHAVRCRPRRVASKRLHHHREGEAALCHQLLHGGGRRDPSKHGL
jgi:hypothetical protein